MGPNYGVDPALEIALYISIVGASLITNAFVILYAFVPWHRSRIGRLFMFRSISLALALDMAIVMLFLPYSPRVMTVVFIAIHAIIGFSTLMLTRYLVEAYKPSRRRHTHDRKPKRSDPIARSDDEQSDV